MLKSKDVNMEAKKLDDYAKTHTDSLGLFAKGLSVIIKLLRDIKTNQVTDLRSRGVKLIEDERETTDEKKDTKQN